MMEEYGESYISRLIWRDGNGERSRATPLKINMMESAVNSLFNNVVLKLMQYIIEYKKCSRIMVFFKKGLHIPNII